MKNFRNRGRRSDDHVKIRESSVCMADRVENYLNMAFGKLYFSDEVKEQAFEIYKNMRVELRFGTSDPIVSAAGILRFAANSCGINITNEDIAEVLDINKVSVVTGYKRIKSFMNV